MSGEACRLLLAALLVVLTSGCGLIYTNVRVPRAYRSATNSDVKSATSDETVSGEACYQSLLYLVAWGDASYAAAAAKALGPDSQDTLYDVKADAQATSILAGLYSRVCTVLTGRRGRP